MLSEIIVDKGMVLVKNYLFIILMNSNVILDIVGNFYMIWNVKLIMRGRGWKIFYTIVILNSLYIIFGSGLWNKK